ncbi:MAG: hypothetical protein FJ038_04370 [Chloroflexi bacterium]|nr:hypothetical protein [Chloroflexota bacterium]
MLKRVGILMAFAAVLLGACGGSAGTTGSASAPVQSAGPAATSGSAPPRSADVCDLIDRPAAETFFGGRTVVHFQSKTACRVTAAAVDLSVTVAPDQSRGDYDKARAARADAVDVAGIGDVADYSPKLSTLTFLKGDTITAIGVVGGGAFDPAAVRAFVEAQARYAASVR